MEEIIKITVKKGTNIQIHEFANNTLGQKKSVKFCQELAKEHLKHPFNRLMDYADKKNDSSAKDYLMEQPFEKPESLSILTAIALKDEKYIDDLL